MFIVGALLKKPRSGGSEIQSPWCDNALTRRDQAWARAFQDILPEWELSVYQLR